MKAHTADKKAAAFLNILADLAVLALVVLVFLWFWKKPLSKSDDSYLQLMDEVITETLDNPQANSISERIVSELSVLETFPPEKIHNGQLRELAQEYDDNLQLLQSLAISDSDSASDPEEKFSDDLAWHEAMVTRGTLLESFCTDFSLLSSRPDLVQCVRDEAAREEALVTAESDLRDQLFGAEPRRIHRNDPSFLNYRNRTEYTLDLVFLNLYQAADGSCSCDLQCVILGPNERVQIRLDNMPEDCVAWVTDWEIDRILSGEHTIL